MIIVKTKLKHMPETCSRCPYYIVSFESTEFYWPGICKVISASLPKKLSPTKERWHKCPLEEVKD